MSKVMTPEELKELQRDFDIANAHHIAESRRRQIEEIKGEVMKNLYENEYYKKGFRLGHRFGYNFQKAIDKVPDEEKKNFESGYNDGCAKYVNETDGFSEER